MFYQLPLFLLGLSMGTVAGAFAGAVAGVGMLIMFGLLGLFVFVVFNAAPVIIIIRQALLFRSDENGDTEWYPSGLLASSATGLALALMTAVFLWMELTTEGMEATIQHFLRAFADNMMAGVSAEQRDQVVNSVAPVLPGVIGSLDIGPRCERCVGTRSRGTFRLEPPAEPGFLFASSASLVADRGGFAADRGARHAGYAWVLCGERSNPFVAAVFPGRPCRCARCGKAFFGGVDVANCILRHDDDVRMARCFRGLHRTDRTIGRFPPTDGDCRQGGVKWKSFYWNELSGSARWAMS